MTLFSRIAGTGGYLPEQIRTNFDIAKTVDTSDEWIVDITGIRSMRIAYSTESVASLAEVAARRALEASGCQPNEI